MFQSAVNYRIKGTKAEWRKRPVKAAQSPLASENELRPPSFSLSLSPKLTAPETNNVLDRTDYRAALKEPSQVV